MADAKPTTEFLIEDWRSCFVSGRLDIRSTLAAHGAFVEKADQEVAAFVALGESERNAQIDTLEQVKQSGQQPGALYGVPVGLKDIIDTEDFATSYGSPIYDGRYAIADATVARRIRRAGGFILGKTATTEFATFHPAKTRNPHNPAHTPGGSSSGSAAAVAAGFVPVSVGTQTNGSVIRPASFCGVYGFKPSFGLVPRTGIFETAPSLDQVGFFGRSLEDMAALAQVVAGDDGHDPASKGRAPHRFYDICREDFPISPRFCFVHTPWWDQVASDAREAYEAFLDLMGSDIDKLVLPDVVTKAVDWHSVVYESELAASLTREWSHHRQQLSPGLQTRLEKAQDMKAVDYLLAQSRIDHVADAFGEFFDIYDAILCPAALGTAPEGLSSTGNPIMQTVWTFGGLPCVNLPFLSGENGLPLGVQAVGPYLQDGRLLRALRWLVRTFDQRSSE
jgi:Asp-tRNA(Asn)/Glu-tRNA(Gln) amidotransferase A subunit family amidase